MNIITVSIIAGLLAGIGTGFAGLSAAVFIAPMLVVLGNVDSFTAVGIALASDVLASAASAVTYKLSGNIDLRRARVLIASSLFFTVIGSIASHYFTIQETGESIMSSWLPLATFLFGLKLLIVPSRKERDGSMFKNVSEDLIELTGGVYVGLLCGFQGTGGGMAMLFVLNILIGYEFRTAVGTSVFIMSLTALIGTISRFTIRQPPDPIILITCIAATLIGAQAAAVIANRIQPVTLKRITGGLMTVSVMIMAVSKL